MSREGNRPEALDERQRSNTSVSAGLLIPPDARQRDYKRVIRKKRSMETIFAIYSLKSVPQSPGDAYRWSFDRGIESRGFSRFYADLADK